jgi:hypothetical protein
MMRLGDADSIAELPFVRSVNLRSLWPSTSRMLPENANDAIIRNMRTWNIQKKTVKRR